MKMCDPSRTKCKHATLTSALRTLLKRYQTDEEDLLACTQRFKQDRDVLKSAVGHKLLDKFITHTKEHKDETDSNKRNEMKEGSFESWMACLCISQANWNKCGSLSDGFDTQCSLENDQFPKTMTRASNVLSDHKFDEAWKEKLKKKKDKDKKSNWTNNNNDAENTNNNKEQEQEKLDTSFRQQGEEITCCVCGKHGHLATECSKWDTAPKSQWWSTKFKQFMQTEQEETVKATAVAEPTSQGN